MPSSRGARPFPWRSLVFDGAPATPRLPGLDALRGLLAVAVATYHLSVWFGLFPSGSFANMAFSKGGNFGVSAFFILSGFLLFRLTDWEKLKREGIGTFYLRRWLRLAPLFYLAVGLNLVFGLGMGPQPTARYVLENLTLCFGAIHPNHALVIGGWYVGLVVLLYAAYPLLAWLREKGGIVFLLLLVGVLWAWSLPYTLHRVIEAPMAERFHLYVLPANQLFLLALGGLLAWLHERIAWRLAAPAFLVLLTGLLVVLLWPEPRFFDHLVPLTGWLRYRHLVIIAGIVLLFSLRGVWPAWLDRPLQRLGLWSYGAYLLHPFLFKFLAPRISGFPAFWSALVLSFAAAALAERWIERPLSQLGKKLSKKQPG